MESTAKSEAFRLAKSNLLLFEKEFQDFIPKSKSEALYFELSYQDKLKAYLDAKKNAPILTIEEKKEELAKRLCAIPIEKWEKTEYCWFAPMGTYDVTLGKGQNGGPPFFQIGNYCLYTNQACQIISALEARDKNNGFEDESAMLDNLLNSIEQ